MRISDWSSDVCSSDLGKTLNQRLRIGKTDILAGEADDAAQDIKRFLTRDQHSGQIVKHRLRIGTAQRFMQGRNEVVMPLPILVVDSHRSEEHTSELQSLMRITYAVFCLKKKTQKV